MVKRRIGIVGAGPAGLTCAISAVTLGLDVTVFERANNFEHVGGGIAVQSNGLRVLQKLELLPALRSLIYPCSTLVLELSGKREIVNDYRTLDIPHNSFSVLLRYDLQESLLTAACQKKISILFGHRCVGAKLRKKKAVLLFADESDQEFDVVIAADGIHSSVRESLKWQGEPKAVGEAYLRGVADIRMGGSAAREIWGIDGRRFGMCPLPADKTYFYCSVPKGEWIDVLAKGLQSWVNSWRSCWDYRTVEVSCCQAASRHPASSDITHRRAQTSRAASDRWLQSQGRKLSAITPEKGTRNLFGFVAFWICAVILYGSGNNSGRFRR